MEEGCDIGDEHTISRCTVSPTGSIRFFASLSLSSTDNRGAPKSALSSVIRYWYYAEIGLSSKQGCAPIVVGGSPGSALIFNDTQPVDCPSVDWCFGRGRVNTCNLWIYRNRKEERNGAT